MRPLLLIALVLLVPLAGCKKLPCGETITQNDDEIEIIGEESNSALCVSNAEYVLNSKKEVKTLIETHACTEDQNLLEVDYFKSTLLSAQISGAIYCDLDNVSVSLSRDCDTKTVICGIEINCPKPPIGTGIPDILKVRRVWIKVPKIPKKYDVSFEVSKID